MDPTGDDSEWEYEYHENETEDFYLVLELPPASSLKTKTKADDLFAAHDPVKKATKAKTSKPRKRRHSSVENEESDVGTPAPGTPTTPTGDGVDQDPTSPAAPPNIEHLTLTASADKPPDGLQLIDLESDEPVIMYQGQMYTCTWSSSIGSDLLFSQRPETPDPSYAPLRSFAEWNLLGIAAAKLIAAPATIERRQDVKRQTELDAPVPSTSDTAVPMAAQHDDVLRQAKFLNRIADIKIARGEQVGNLKGLAESVFTNPEDFRADGKKRRGGGRGRARAAAPSPSRQSEAGATETPASWDVAMGGDDNRT